MNTKIYCKTTRKGEHSFYLVTNSSEYFLFTQAYRRGVQKYFRNGICLEEIYDFSKAKRDNAIIRTFCKLPNYIRYVENEYGIIVLKQTMRKHQHSGNSGRLSA